MDAAVALKNNDGIRLRKKGSTTTLDKKEVVDSRAVLHEDIDEIKKVKTLCYINEQYH
jgi:hypothetical protein